MLTRVCWVSPRGTGWAGASSAHTHTCARDMRYDPPHIIHAGFGARHARACRFVEMLRASDLYGLLLGACRSQRSCKPPWCNGARGCCAVNRNLHRDWAHPCPHLLRDCAHPRHIRSGTGPRPTPSHIFSGTGLTPPTSAPGLGPPRPRLHRTGAHPTQAPARSRWFGRSHLARLPYPRSCLSCLNAQAPARSRCLRRPTPRARRCSRCSTRSCAKARTRRPRAF